MEIETTLADLPKYLEKLPYPPEAKVHLIVEDVASAKENSILGLFANDAELLEQITESIMQSRENDPLRFS